MWCLMGSGHKTPVLQQPMAVASPDEPIPLQPSQALRPVKDRQFKLKFKITYFSLSVDMSSADVCWH